MPFLSSFLMLAAIAFGGWYTWNEYPQVRQFIATQIPSHEVYTLEARYTPEQIMEQNKEQLLTDARHTFLNPTLELHPYVLMKVKFVRNQSQTREGSLLWSLEDGEMVTNADTWERSHGFRDCLALKANQTDFKILNALSQKGGQLDRQGMLNILHADPDLIDQWIESCKKKQLIIQHGNYYSLHLERPRLAMEPITHLNDPFVQKPKHEANAAPKRYSASQIGELAKAAFGQHFAIRSQDEVYLPVYVITIKNPDGSTRSTRWNALTGQTFNL